jgi:uncharacterized repeat protein (TIGR03803 family)
LLYSFPASGTAGEYPEAGLLQYSSGNFYGTTVEGGDFGKGVVFQLTPAGVETVLHSFAGGADGASPMGSTLNVDKSGRVFGVTNTGGAFNAGVAFEIQIPAP